MKHFFTKLFSTRIPCILAMVVAFLVAGFMEMQCIKANKPVNQYLHHEHAVNVIRIHTNQDRIFKYRAQMSAMSDSHMLYIIHHPKLKNHIQYMNLTGYMMKLNDRDNGLINQCQYRIDHERHQLKKDHSHNPSKNAFGNGPAKVYGPLVHDEITDIFAIAFGVLFLWKAVVFRKHQDKRYERLEGK